MFKRKVPKISGDAAISTLFEVTLGNEKQWVYVRGWNKHNPIVLLLHGGPGAAQIGFARKFQEEMEQDFVVVNWDQRGAGLSYKKNIPAKSMTIQQFVDDTIELTQYLCSRFQQEKIYILGHSWGSILGMLAIHEHPSLYKRYFGIAQVADLLKSDQLSYSILLEKATQNKKAYIDLKRIGPPPWHHIKEDRIHQKYIELYGGGLSHDGKLMKQIIRELVWSKEYTLSDKIRYVKGQLFSMRHVMPELRTLRLQQHIKKVEIPIYFCMGRHDLTVPYQPTKEFFDSLEAAEKHWIWFENSAHTPIFEEKDTFIELLTTEVEKDKG